MHCDELNAWMPAQPVLSSLNCGISLITTVAICTASSLTATSEAAASSLVTRSPRWTRPCRLDRLGRSVLHLVTLGAELRERGVGLHVTEQGIDTTTAKGRAMFGMLSVLTLTVRRAAARDRIGMDARPNRRRAATTRSGPREHRPDPRAARTPQLHARTTTGDRQSTARSPAACATTASRSTSPRLRSCTAR
jgi:hypothetical protein